VSQLFNEIPNFKMWVFFFKDPMLICSPWWRWSCSYIHTYS